MSHPSVNLPRLDAQITLEDDGAAARLAVRYTIINPLAIPLLVFDRRWSDSLDDFDDEQVDVVFEADRAVLRRCYVDPPEGVLAGDDLVPYGRIVEPGASVLTTLHVPVPLHESGAWLRLRRRALVPRESRDATIRRVALEIGWSTLLDRDALPSECRDGIERRGEILLPVPAGLIAAAQQIVVSETFYFTLAGSRFADGVLE